MNPTSIKSPELAESAAGAHDPYSALRLRDYRLFLAGTVIAVIGQQMQTVAVGWQLYEQTGSAFALGGVGLVQVLPIIALALPAGHVADRFDRKRVLMTAVGLLALSSLGLATVSARHGSIALIYAWLLLSGVGRAFQGPAKTAFLPQIVPRRYFSNAVSWNSGGFHLASVLGPALGGAAIALLKSATAVYVLDAAATLTFFGLLALIIGRPLTPPLKAATLRTLAAGVSFVWRTKVLLAAITLDLFAVLLGGAVTLLPIYAKDILRVGPSGLGWLRAAPAVGALAMAFALAHLPPLRKAGKTMLVAVACFGLATIVFGLSRSFWLSLLMLSLTGAFDNISVVVRHTLVQLLPPDEVRGRVAAVNGMFIGTSNELGGFESGAVAALFGPVVSVVSGSIGTLVVVLAVALIWPQIRRFGALDGD